MQRNNTLAIVSLVAGIISYAGAPVAAAIVAVICGHIARKQIRSSGGRETGDGLALIGLILGWVNLLGGVVLILLFVFGFASLACLGAVADASG